MERISFLHVTAARAVASALAVAAASSAGCSGESSVTRGSSDETTSAPAFMGSFDLRAFLTTDSPWTVFLASGAHAAVYDGSAQTYTRSKDYTVSILDAPRRQTGMVAGVPTTLLRAKRDVKGTAETVELIDQTGRPFARLDGTKVTSLAGFDEAQTHRAMRIDPDYDGNKSLGQIEQMKAPWARIYPASFYYGADPGAPFGITVVEKMMVAGQYQNFVQSTPGKERMREGTYWCLSDTWQLNENAFTSLFKGDVFDMGKCNGTRLASSETKHGIIDDVGAYKLNRQDSIVNVHTIGKKYYVKARREWFCAFDCDGTTYSIHLDGEDAPSSVHVSTNKYNARSETKFKVKVVRANFDGDPGFDATTRKIASAGLEALGTDAALRKHIVAIIVSEVRDQRGSGGEGSYTDSQWLQNTWIMIPPGAPVSRLDDLDGILAMMPDQTQSSPELGDVEEKLDELLYWMKARFGGTEGFAKWRRNEPRGDVALDDSPDGLFDVLSETDATTAITWKRPGASAPVEGKIERMLRKLRR